MSRNDTGQIGTQNDDNHSRSRSFNRAQLLTRLRRGPLDSRKWAEVATTRKELHVRICHLRDAGYRIAAEPIQNAGTPVPPVRYVLRGEPCCAHCGRGGK